MTGSFTFVPIVEGEGEVQAVPVLLRRIAALIRPDLPVAVSTSIRVPRDRLLKPVELERYVGLAALNQGEIGATLLLVDADDDCAATLGPDLLLRASAVRPDRSIGVVIAVREFEAWFLAAAASLSGKRGLPDDLQTPVDTEAIRDAKGWLQTRRIDGLAYRPRLDQPALASIMDLEAARSGSPSFDKFWREVGRLLPEADSTGSPDNV